MAEENVNLASLGKASFPDLKTPGSRHESPQRAAAELIADGSIELSSGDPDQVSEVVDLLPFGTPVFVPVLPLHDMDSRIAVIRELREKGFDPVPHIAARRMPSRQALVAFLSRVVEEAQVHRVLLIGGDSQEPAGPFADAASILHDGVIAECGVAEVSLAGYPEGHSRIDPETLQTALHQKLTLAAEQGLGAHVVTQFSFVPQRVLEFCTDLYARSPDTPVYVGMAGPASLRQLVHFARYCGVSASLSAVRKVGVKVAQLVDHRRADEQLASLAQFNASHDRSNIIGIHVFSFGGFRATARWMNEHLHLAKS